MVVFPRTRGCLKLDVDRIASLMSVVKGAEKLEMPRPDGRLTKRLGLPASLVFFDAMSFGSVIPHRILVNV